MAPLVTKGDCGSCDTPNKPASVSPELLRAPELPPHAPRGLQGGLETVPHQKPDLGRREEQTGAVQSPQEALRAEPGSPGLAAVPLGVPLARRRWARGHQHPHPAGRLLAAALLRGNGFSSLSHPQSARGRGRCPGHPRGACCEQRGCFSACCFLKSFILFKYSQTKLTPLRLNHLHCTETLFLPPVGGGRFSCVFFSCSFGSVL